MPSPVRVLQGLLVAVAVALLSPGVRAQTACDDCHDVEPDGFASSVHGGLDCADCHEGSLAIPHEEAPVVPECSGCHDEIVTEYVGSAHGRSRAGGATEAATCAACHGEFHSLIPLSDPESPVHPHLQARMCGQCHADPEVIAKYGIPVARPMEAYEASVHARAVDNGNGGATCSACHGSHDLRSASDPRSKVFHQNVADTCGACHQKIAEAYRGSVHGDAAAHGAREAPVCTDCHGEHRILSPSEPGSPVYATNVPKMTCGRCHGDLRLGDKYGLAAGKVEAYADSYHGLAARSGRVTVAHCGSCHGVHGVLPSSDPASPIHPDNVAATCGQCHPGAGTRFPIGEVHIIPTERDHAAVYWIRNLYLILIYVTVGGMAAHNLMDLYRKARGPHLSLPPEVTGTETRMLPAFRVAHGLLIVSFILLVYTGFALTYPESWWAQPLLQWEESLGLRGWLHRGAALAMLAALAIHFVHLLVSRRARTCIAQMWPRLSDLEEVREKILYLAGRRAEPPPAPRVGYAEKMEYLALMWGILVMAVTGGLLWFDNLVLRWLPKWVEDVATVIHFYEAILASLAILVWHFYFVIFDPVVYPMDTAWLTGHSHPGRVLERREEQGPEKPAAGTGDTRRYLIRGA
jgi:cytochrome b subunit of formate dehydrogenase